MSQRLPVIVLGSALLLSACNAPPGEPSAVSQQTQALDTSRLLTWASPGEGNQTLGFRAAVTERPAMGVPAVAVGPKGEVLVLDALNKRILRLEEGALKPIAHVEEDADDLVIGPDGAFAVRRQLTAKISIFDPSGAPAGEIDSSAVHEVDAVSLGVSRRVSVTNAYQESYLLGSPSAPLPTQVVIQSRREGAGFLADRAGVSVVASDGAVELLVHAARQAGEEERTVVRGRTKIGSGNAARIIGALGNVVCMRVEHVSTGAAGALDVTREAVCVDAPTGKTLLRQDLGAPGLYTPRRELSFGGSPARLVFIRPEAAGLRVSSWSVGGAK